MKKGRSLALKDKWKWQQRMEWNGRWRRYKMKNDGGHDVGHDGGK